MIKAFIKAARLRTLPLSVSGIILAAFLADFMEVFRWDICVLSLVLTIAFQVLSNFANDYGDGVKGTDNDEDRIGPKRALQSGSISQNQMKKAIIISSLFSFILALVLIFTAFDIAQIKYLILFIAFGVLSIWAAIKYTVGDSAYGYRGLGDLFVFLFFGCLSVVGGYFLYDQSLFAPLLFPAAAIGFLATAVLNLNNMRDQVGDKKSGKMTIPVKIGFKKAKIYHTFLIVSPMIFALEFQRAYTLHSWQNYVYLIAFIPLFRNLYQVIKTDDQHLRNLDKGLKVVALSTFLFALLFGIGIQF